jgi:hypothetical protein
LVSVFLASERFDSDLELDGGMHKTYAHPCPPKTHGYGWAWAWAWVWAPNVGLWYIVFREKRKKGRKERAS